MELELFLKEVIKDNHRHACWLNSLSYLEYRGFRKILRSQSTEEMTVEILKHIQEEVRHSLILKNFSMKLGGEDFVHYSNSTMIFGDGFKKYFYNLDLEIANLKTPNVYHSVTAAIEERALEVYRVYEKVLLESGIGISIQSIINDEEKHLNHYSQEIENAEVENLKIIERNCFKVLWEGISI